MLLIILKKNHKMRLLFIQLILQGCIIMACKHAPVDQTPQRTIKVKVMPVKIKQISLPVICSGIVTLNRETRLSFKTGGIISDIRVEEGARVKRGEVLATLNLSEVESQVDQVKNGYEKALRDFNRAKKLYADSVITLEQMQNAETALNISRSNLEMAQFNKDHSRITAPDNGTILKRLAEPNEMIAPGYPVFLFGTEGRFWKIKTGLADRDFVKVQSGDSAVIALDAYPDSRFRGVVNQISESANPMTGTYDVELDLQPAGYKLASGFVANLEIYPLRKQPVSIIPIGSLVQADGQTGYLFR